MINKVLTRLENDRQKHALFLNSLSVLEYAGARKIIKSQKAEDMTSELLAHVAEEMRHARLLKNLALHLSDGKLTTYGAEHLLAGDEAWNYIQGVDYGVAKDLGEAANPRLNYLYTTLLIEERAMEVYPAYEPILKGFGFSNPLAGLIAEEEHHLLFTRKAVATSDAEGATRLLRLKIMEAAAFKKFMDKIFHTLEMGSDQKRVQTESFPAALAPTSV